MHARPGRTAIAVVSVGAAAMLLVRVAGVSASAVTLGGTAWLLLVLLMAAGDLAWTRRAWHRSLPSLSRRLPAAFAIGVRREVHLTLRNAGPESWRVDLFDHADPSLDTDGLPVALTLGRGSVVTTVYRISPTARGTVTFAAAAVRVRSRWGFWELLDRLGPTEQRRVYPDFAQVARYAWLAGDRRLQEIGIKTYRQRGEGTDFAQLSEYRAGDSVRHIDWKATLRVGKPVVREFQDERDQCVVVMMDCGRRMRPDDRPGGVGTTHFDQAMNAVMLLSYVALTQGDAVGAMTFGTPPGEGRWFAPRKGARTLNALIGQLFAVQPTLAPSDYLSAARDLLTRQHKRALVILITNFRDEDGTELDHALRLLRTRHLVLVASLRERVVGDLLEQPLTTGDAAVAVASAHLYEQARRDAFNRLAARDALMVDAIPERLGVDLVNRYHAVKRSGLI